MRNQRGFSIAEMLIVIAIIGLSAGVGAPAFMTLNRRAATRAAAEIRTIFHSVRSSAIAEGRHAGVKSAGIRTPRHNPGSAKREAR